MMFESRLLTPEEYLRRRYRLRPWIEALSKSDADQTPPKWYDDQVTAGLAHALEVLQNGETKGLVLCEVLDFASRRELNVLGISIRARGWKKWLWPKLLEYARERGCTAVRGTTARPEACQRSMYDRVGMSRHAVTYRAELQGDST